jgi:hypothetical protein
MKSLIPRNQISNIDDTSSMLRVFQQSRLYGGRYVDEPQEYKHVWPAGWLTKRREKLARRGSAMLECKSFKIAGSSTVVPLYHSY